MCHHGQGGGFGHDSPFVVWLRFLMIAATKARSEPSSNWSRGHTEVFVEGRPRWLVIRDQQHPPLHILHAPVRHGQAPYRLRFAGSRGAPANLAGTRYSRRQIHSRAARRQTNRHGQPCRSLPLGAPPAMSWSRSSTLTSRCPVQIEDLRALLTLRPAYGPQNRGRPRLDPLP